MTDKQTFNKEKDLFSWKDFLKMPVIGIVRHITAETIVQILPLYQAAGLTTIEITMNSEGAVDIIRHASSEYGNQLNIGAGTVCSLRELDTAIQAGAQFIVTPVTDEEIISHCVEIGIPVFPGAFTPTEIFKAWKTGADMVKIFPATALQPRYINDLKGPMEQIKLMPTGGIDTGKAIAWLDAGATAVGMGSELFNKGFIKNEDWQSLQAHFESVVKAVKPCTG